SSRRRHTRSKRDWSSDVCSSDLTPLTDSLLLEPTEPFSPMTNGGLPVRPRQEIDQSATQNSSVITMALSRLGPLGRLSPHGDNRSEERRVGKGCRSRGG